MRHDQTPLQVFRAEPRPSAGAAAAAARRLTRRDHTLPLTSQPLAPPVPVLPSAAAPGPLPAPPPRALPVDPPPSIPLHDLGAFDPRGAVLAFSRLDDACDRPLRRLWRRLVGALRSLFA